MSDYNRGALSEPCMRLPYGFGGDWASIELGDGTGYVRLADYEKVVSENAKLREYAKLMHNHIKECCDACGECGICDVDALTRKLGIEVHE